VVSASAFCQRPVPVHRDIGRSAINQLLQYRQAGPWRDYRFGEAVYVGLSLVAKSALAWQVFANTLVPT
jgi:hypothetical protein